MLSAENGEFKLVCCIFNHSVLEFHSRRLYINSCFTTGVIDAPINNRVKEFFYFPIQKRVFINGQNGNNVYFYRFDFLKIHFLTFSLRNNIDIINSEKKKIMTEYLLTEVEISSDEEFQDTEKIDLATRSDVDFINHDDIDYDDDVDFYCQTNKNLLLDELSAAKHNARKLRIEFEGESKYVEED